MKATLPLLAMLFSAGSSPQTSSCFPHCHQCEIYTADWTSRQVLKKVRFSPLTGEEELTTRVLQLPGSRLQVTASVFYTDESMASKAGADSMQLAVAVSKRTWPDAFQSPNNAVSEVTLSTFGTARVETNVRSGARRFLIGMECKDKTLSQ